MSRYIHFHPVTSKWNIMFYVCVTEQTSTKQ